MKMFLILGNFLLVFYSATLLFESFYASIILFFLSLLILTLLFLLLEVFSISIDIGLPKINLAPPSSFSQPFYQDHGFNSLSKFLLNITLLEIFHHQDAKQKSYSLSFAKGIPLYNFHFQWKITDSKGNQLENSFTTLASDQLITHPKQLIDPFVIDESPLPHFPLYISAILSPLPNSKNPPPYNYVLTLSLNKNDLPTPSSITSHKFKSCRSNFKQIQTSPSK